MDQSKKAVGKLLVVLAVLTLAAVGRAHADTLGLAGLERMAKSGNVPAENQLGLAYLRGNGIEQDFSKARYWFEKAAAHHGPAAMCNLGEMRLRGLGVRQDDAKAAAWFKKSADMHYVPAQYEMGYLYQNGIGVPKDLGQAQLYYELAAYAGYRPAALALAQIRGEQQLQGKNGNSGSIPVTAVPKSNNL